MTSGKKGAKQNKAVLAENTLLAVRDAADIAEIASD